MNMMNSNMNFMNNIMNSNMNFMNNMMNSNMNMNMNMMNNNMNMNMMNHNINMMNNNMNMMNNNMNMMNNMNMFPYVMMMNNPFMMNMPNNMGMRNPDISPVRRNVLESLPESTLDDITKLDGEKKNCVICLNDFEVGEKVMILPCVHMFHSECIRDWFEAKDTCPICKFKLSPENINSNQ